MKITIVEDGFAYAETLQEVLVEAGHEVTLLCSFIAGLDNCVEKIKTSQPDVVLLDHDLGASFTGADVAAHLTSYTLISISSDRRAYCQKYFGSKVMLERNPTAVKQELLGLL